MLVPVLLTVLFTHTGLVCCHLCDSCYLASVVQVLFHLPPFHRRYWVDGQRHINECRNGRPADCFACQMVKVGDGIYSGRYAVVPSEEQLDESRKEREAREAEKERARQGTAMDVDKPQDSDAVRRKKQVREADLHCQCTAASHRASGTDRSRLCCYCIGLGWLRCVSFRPASHHVCSSGW